MSKRFFPLFVFAFFTLGLTAQSGSAVEKNDPEAKKILDKIRKKYEAYKTNEAGFSLSIELPGQPKEIQKGTIAQEGNKFRLDMDAQTIISDGKTTWVYLKKNNEVQINNTDPNDANGFLTPKELLRRYQKGDFLYTITEKITEKITENGKPVTNIEFKPKDRNSDYSKLRLSVNEQSASIVSIKAFQKDGSRFTFSLTKTTPNKAFAAGHFSFDPQKYPGVKVEDLRL